MDATKTSATPPTSPRSAVDEQRAAIMARGRDVLQAESAAILEARTRLGQPFVGAVRTILACKGRVCVTGVGKAGLIGQKIQATLASTGTLSYSLHPVEALHGDLGMIHAEDVVLALSKSGSSELVELLPRLRKMGCSIVLITSRTDSTAASFADWVLDIGQTEEACPLGLAPSSSTAAMLAVGDAIALTVMEQKAVRPEQYASWHPGGALGRYLLKAGEIMRTGANCPAVPISATLNDCYEAILKAPQRAGAAAVVDASGQLAGIVTQGDVFRLVTRSKCSPETLVEAVMTKTPKHVRSESRAIEALQLMRQHAIDELPVVEDDMRLAGMIDIQDLIARGFSVFDNS